MVISILFRRRKTVKKLNSVFLVFDQHCYIRHTRFAHRTWINLIATICFSFMTPRSIHGPQAPLAFLCLEANHCLFKVQCKDACEAKNWEVPPRPPRNLAELPANSSPYELEGAPALALGLYGVSVCPPETSVCSTGG